MSSPAAKARRAVLLAHAELDVAAGRLLGAERLAARPATVAATRAGALDALRGYAAAVTDLARDGRVRTWALQELPDPAPLSLDAEAALAPLLASMGSAIATIRAAAAEQPRALAAPIGQLAEAIERLDKSVRAVVGRIVAAAEARVAGAHAPPDGGGAA